MLQFGKDTFENSVYQPDVAEVEAALQVTHGVRPDHFRRPLDVHAAKPCSSVEQCLSAQAKTSMTIVRSLEVMVGSQDAPAPAKTTPSLRGAANVVALTRRSSKPSVSAEDALPLEKTGTYGRF